MVCHRGCSLLVRTRHVGQVSEYTDMPDLRAEQPSMAFQKLQLRNRDLYTTSSVTALEREALPDGAYRRGRGGGEDHNSRRDREETHKDHFRVSVCPGSETLTDQLH